MWLCNKLPITIANGTIIPIDGIRELNFINYSKLKNVLYIPQLPSNLIYVQKLIRELKCMIIFFEKKVLLVDNHKLMKIGEKSAQQIACDMDKLLNYEECIIIHPRQHTVTSMNRSSIQQNPPQDISKVNCEQQNMWSLHPS